MAGMLILKRAVFAFRGGTWGDEGCGVWLGGGDGDGGFRTLG